MQVYGTPIALIPLNEAAALAELSEAAFLAQLAINGKHPILISANKLGVTAADLDEVSASASATANIRPAIANDTEGHDSISWQTPDIDPAVAITGTPVETGEAEVAYAGFTVEATGWDAPFTYSLVGTWPDGIVVDAETGVVSGTPTEDGTFADISVRATGSSPANTADLTLFTLVIDPA